MTFGIATGVESNGLVWGGMGIRPVVGLHTVAGPAPLYWIDQPPGVTPLVLSISPSS